jgi:hypothetical protein
MTLSSWILPETKNVSDKCEEKIKYFTANSFFVENLAVSEIITKNMAEADRPQTFEYAAIWEMQFAFGVFKTEIQINKLNTYFFRQDESVDKMHFAWKITKSKIQS